MPFSRCLLFLGHRITIFDFLDHYPSGGYSHLLCRFTDGEDLYLIEQFPERFPDEFEEYRPLHENEQPDD